MADSNCRNIKKNGESHDENLDIRKSEKEKPLHSRDPSAPAVRPDAGLLSDLRKYSSWLCPEPSHGTSHFCSLHHCDCIPDLGSGRGRAAFPERRPYLLSGQGRRNLCHRRPEIHILPERAPRIYLHAFQNPEDPEQPDLSGRSAGEISLPKGISPGPGTQDPVRGKNKRKQKILFHDLPCRDASAPSEPSDLCLFKGL